MGFRLLIRHDLPEGDAGGVVIQTMDELPNRGLPSAAVALAPGVAGDAITDAVDPAELFDIDVHCRAQPLLRCGGAGVRCLQKPIERMESTEAAKSRCLRHIVHRWKEIA